MFHRLNTKKAPAGQDERVPRVGAHVSADHRRPAGPRRAARHPAGDRRPGHRCRWTGRSACCCSIRTTTGEVRRPAADHRESARRRTARRGRDRPDGADAADAARRDGRRRRRRQLAALRRAARLRRPARGVLRHARGVRAAGARAGSSACRSTRADTAPIGWRCRRASSTSAARRRRRTSAPRRRCSPTSPRCTRSSTARRGCARSASAFTAWRARSRTRSSRHGLRQTNAAYFDTLRIEGANAARVSKAAVAAGINFRYFEDGAIGISRRRDDHHRGRRRHRQGVHRRRRRPVFKDGAPVRI